MVHAQTTVRLKKYHTKFLKTTACISERNTLRSELVADSKIRAALRWRVNASMHRNKADRIKANTASHTVKHT